MSRPCEGGADIPVCPHRQAYRVGVALTDSKNRGMEMIGRFLIALFVVTSFCACGSDLVMTPDLERGLHEVGNLTRPRNLHVATRLQNGKVLIAGGNAALPPAGGGVWESDYLDSAEIFDPETGISTRTGDLAVSRYRDHGTLLPDGRVLMISSSGRKFPIEMYDAHSGRFDAVADAPLRFGTSTATLLPNGEVLLIGGSPAGGRWRVFDPAKGKFSATITMEHPGFGHTATLLKDGRVLIVGGAHRGIELTGWNLIYDPSSEGFSRAGNLQVDRVHHKAVLLQDGRVLIVGGYAGNGPRVQTAEIYDPESNTFSPAGTSAMNPIAALLLPSGRVFFVHRDNGNIALYNPDTQVFSPTGHSIGAWRSGATVTLLDDGRVVIAGGVNWSDGGHSAVPESISDQIFIFTP